MESERKRRRQIRATYNYFHFPRARIEIIVFWELKATGDTRDLILLFSTLSLAFDLRVTWRDFLVAENPQLFDLIWLIRPWETNAQLEKMFANRFKFLEKDERELPWLSHLTFFRH